jgi:hypothetical protein
VLAVTGPTSSNGQRPALDLRGEARRLWLDAAAEGTPVSGAELARRFGRSPAWGRQVAAEARQAQSLASARQPAATRPPGEAATPVSLAVAPPRDRQALRHKGDTLIVLAVALVAAAASYGHMLEVALLAGEPLWLARAFPITVDGLALAALRRSEAGRRWLALALAVSVAANVGAQFPAQAEAAGPLVSAWPPLALYGTHRLVHRR